MYVLSIFFPGYKNVGGYHGKYSIQQFYEKMENAAGIGFGFTDKITKWLVGWQRFTIPGMELETSYSNGLPIPSCVEFKVIPHIMTPLKAFKFLYNLVPEGETVLFLDLLLFDYPFDTIYSSIVANKIVAPVSARVLFQENNSFFYETMLLFQKNKDSIFLNESDEFTIKIMSSSTENSIIKAICQRKLVSIEEIAILEFYTNKYPTINDGSARILQYLGGKLNVNIDIDIQNKPSKDLETFVMNSCQSLISCQSSSADKKKEIKVKEINKARPRIVF